VVPALFLEGMTGAFWQPIATSYVLALLASFVVALTLTPALSVMLLRNASLQRGDSPLTRVVRGVYNALFSWATTIPRPAFVAVCVMALIGFLLFPFMRQESLLPDFKETDLVVRMEGNSSASHPAISRIIMLASRELRSIPGVRNVSAHVGRAIMSDKRTNINSGEVRVSIDPSADYEATVAAVKQVVAGYPGLSPEVLTYLQAKVREELSGTGESLAVRVYGEDMNMIRNKAEEVQKVLAGIGGIANAKVQYPREMPTVEIEVDIEKAKRYNLKPGDVRRAATSLVSGIVVGALFEEQKVFDVVVWGTPETRHSVTNVRNLLIDTPSGDHVRLSDVAHVRIVPSVTEIHRDAVARYVDVTASVRGRDLGSVGDEVEDRLEKVTFPLEYRAELLGEYVERDAAEERLLAYAIAAAIGIFLLLQVFFRSWRLATVIFLTLPMALVGGVVAAFLTGGGLLSLGAIVGFIAVLGIVVRNSITLINRYRNLEREGETFGTELVQRATKERSAPILMTGVTTVLVFLPLALFGNIAGLEIVHPTAIVVLGGLVTATIYTLAGVPAMYVLFGAAREAELDLEEVPGRVVTEEEMREGMVRA
jgi:Cu/Ag efflux pump CusA